MKNKYTPKCPPNFWDKFKLSRFKRTLRGRNEEYKELLTFELSQTPSKHGVKERRALVRLGNWLTRHEVNFIGVLEYTKDSAPCYLILLDRGFSLKTEAKLMRLMDKWGLKKIRIKTIKDQPARQYIIEKMRLGEVVKPFGEPPSGYSEVRLPTSVKNVKKFQSKF